MKRAEEDKLEAEIPGLAQHQQRMRDLAIILATIAACQEATKTWFCCPVTIRIDIDAVMKGFP